jgi:hypothetical protein
MKSSLIGGVPPLCGCRGSRGRASILLWCWVRGSFGSIETSVCSMEWCRVCQQLSKWLARKPYCSPWPELRGCPFSRPGEPRDIVLGVLVLLFYLTGEYNLCNGCCTGVLYPHFLLNIMICIPPRKNISES